MDEMLILIAEYYEKNSIGVMVPQESSRPAWCRVQSITRAEWYEAGTRGLQPAFMVLTNAINYNGEKIAELNGKRYSIYRTYQPRESDEIELYLEERVGVSYGEGNSN